MLIWRTIRVLQHSTGRVREAVQGGQEESRLDSAEEIRPILDEAEKEKAKTKENVEIMMDDFGKN